MSTATAEMPAESPRFRVLIYWASGNIGDMVQTAAMSRLLPQTVGIHRHKIGADKRTELPFVVNGYLNQGTSKTDGNTLFAGVFVGGHMGGDREAHYEWLRRSPHPVGARDPYSAELMRQNGVDAFFLGCATLTLPRYEGPRAGIYSVDFAGPGKRIGNAIPHDMKTRDQWKLALERIELLRTAEVVYTSRLHVALPCLAMGTPVVIQKPAIGKTMEPERFNILDALQIPYGELVTYDTSPIRERFQAFLSKHLGVEITPGDFKEPQIGT